MTHCMSDQLKEIKVLIPKAPRVESLLPYLKQIDQNRIYTNFGPLNDELIGRLSSYTGFSSQKIGTCANATLAIQGLILTSPTQGKVWELPVWTFTATAAAALNSGKTLKFVDANLEWRANFDSISSVQNSLIDVAPFGDSILSDPVRKCGALIIDAAPSFDSLRNLSIHNDYPVAIVVSLHATKLLPAGEGSFVLSNSEEWISKFRSWTNFGMNDERVSQFIGTNAKLSEYSAAVALASLDIWNENRAKFIELSAKALEISHRLGFVTSPAMERGLVTPYWILVLKDTLQKKRLGELLEMNRVGWRDWWKDGIHRMPAYAGLVKGNYPIANQLSSITIGLPMHYYLSDQDFDRVSRILEQIKNS